MPTAYTCSCGRLRCAAFRLWFVTEDLRRLMLIPSATSGRSRRAALLTCLNDRQKRRERRWVRGADLAEHFAHQRGPTTTSERQALRDEGCQQIFRSLLHGDFTDERQLPHVRPHYLTNAILRRMTPIVGGSAFFGSDGRDRDGEPVLSDHLRRKLMREVWLPVRCVMFWCQDRNMRLPNGYAALAPTPAAAIDGINDRRQLGPLHARTLMPRGGRAGS